MNFKRACMAAIVVFSPHALAKTKLDLAANCASTSGDAVKLQGFAAFLDRAIVDAYRTL